MGACCSKPEADDDYLANNLKTSPDYTHHSHHSHQSNSSNHSYHIPQYHDTVKRKMPDFGLGGLYEVIKVLGKGGTGETWLCKDCKTEELLAVKLIKRPIPKVVVPMIMMEIQIQADLGEGHLNIVAAREVLLSHSHLALIMEFAAGGNLTGYVSERWNSTYERGGLFLTEEEARYFFKQFISAVEYCHSHHVAHRDLKLDNTLLDHHQPPRIKLCDFGFAKQWGDGGHMFTQIGTPVYMSPQLIKSKGGGEGYDGRKADVWAGGVLLFVMMLGMFPFDHAEHHDPNSSAAHAEVWLQQVESSWRENPKVALAAERLSEECRDLLDHVFNLDEKQRLDIAGIKSHPWFNLPLSPALQGALDQLAREQAAAARGGARGLTKSKDRDAALEELMEAASRTGSEGEAVLRVSLSRVQQRCSFDSHPGTPRHHPHHPHQLDLGKVGDLQPLAHDTPAIMEVDSSQLEKEEGEEEQQQQQQQEEGVVQVLEEEGAVGPPVEKLRHNGVHVAADAAVGVMLEEIAVEGGR